MPHRFLVILGVFGLLAARSDQPPPTVSGPAEDSTAAIARTLIGSWRLDVNPRFTRTFRTGGSVTDRFQGDDSSATAGSWRLFTAKDRDPLLDSVVRGVTYLRIANGDDVTFYAIVKADRLHLRMRYADRGGSLLRFTRVAQR